MRWTLPLTLLLSSAAAAQEPEPELDGGSEGFGNLGFGELEPEEAGPLTPVVVRQATATVRRAPGQSKVASLSSALAAFDGDAATAWVFPADAVGARLVGAVAPVPSARRAVLSVRNGCQKSAKTLPSLAAPSQVRVELSWGGGVVATLEATLDRRAEATEWTIPVPDDQGVDQLSVEVLAVEPGGADACISDLALSVESPLSLNEAAETAAAAGRGAALAAEAKRDKARAKPPGGWAFATGEWRLSPAAPLAADALDAAFEEGRAALKAAEASAGFYALPLAPDPLTPAGLLFPDAAALGGALPLFVAGGPKLQASTDDVAYMNGAATDAGSFEEWRSSYKVLWSDGEGSAPATVAFDARHTSKVHATYETYTQTLARFVAGRVDALFVHETHAEEGSAPFRATDAIYRFSYDDRGRISGVTVHRQATDGTTGQEAWQYGGA